MDISSRTSAAAHLIVAVHMTLPTQRIGPKWNRPWIRELPNMIDYSAMRSRHRLLADTGFAPWNKRASLQTCTSLPHTNGSEIGHNRPLSAPGVPGMHGVL